MLSFFFPVLSRSVDQVLCSTFCMSANESMRAFFLSAASRFQLNPLSTYYSRYLLIFPSHRLFSPCIFRLLMKDHLGTISLLPLSTLSHSPCLTFDRPHPLRPTLMIRCSSRPSSIENHTRTSLPNGAFCRAANGHCTRTATPSSSRMR